MEEEEEKKERSFNEEGSIGTAFKYACSKVMEKFTGFFSKAAKIRDDGDDAKGDKESEEEERRRKKKKEERRRWGGKCWKSWLKIHFPDSLSSKFKTHRAKKQDDDPDVTFLGEYRKEDPSVRTLEASEPNTLDSDEDEVKLVKVANPSSSSDEVAERGAIPKRRSIINHPPPRSFEITNAQQKARAMYENEPGWIMRNFKAKCHPNTTNFTRNFLAERNNRMPPDEFFHGFPDSQSCAPGKVKDKMHRGRAENTVQWWNRQDDLKEYQKLLDHQRDTQTVGSYGGVTRAELSSSSTEAKRKQIEERHLATVSTATGRSPIVVDLCKDDDGDDKPVIEKEVITIPERPKERGKDDDITGLLAQYSSPASRRKSPRKKDGINSLEAELRTKKVYDDDFLKNIQETAEAKRQELRIKTEQQAATRDFYKKRNTAAEDSVAERVEEYLRITEVNIEETFDEEGEELPEITEEMRAVISRALSSSGETLIDRFNIPISINDVSTLTGLNWLNDEIINFYMNLICERSKTVDNWPTTYAFNTFFYPKIVEKGHAAVKRWTRKVDIFSFDLLLVPVHLGVHWCLATVDLKNKGIHYYDSMGGDNKRCLEALREYLQEEHVDKKRTPLDTSGYRLVIEKDIPQQQNGSDCGMFTLKFAEYLSRNARITFDQEDMPYFRNRMIYEIVAGDIKHP